MTTETVNFLIPIPHDEFVAVMTSTYKGRVTAVDRPVNDEVRMYTVEFDSYDDALAAAVEFDMNDRLESGEPNMAQLQ
jgi:hypothetical protein